MAPATWAHGTGGYLDALNHLLLFIDIDPMDGFRSIQGGVSCQCRMVQKYIVRGLTMGAVR